MSMRINRRRHPIPQDIRTISYKDNYVPFVPKHLLSVMADYHIGKFTIGANVSGQGKTWWDEANTFAQKFYAVMGAHADYDFRTCCRLSLGTQLDRHEIQYLCRHVDSGKRSALLRPEGKSYSGRSGCEYSFLKQYTELN